jgi:hypothetical protein
MFYTRQLIPLIMVLIHRLFLINLVLDKIVLNYSWVGKIPFHCAIQKNDHMQNSEMVSLTVQQFLIREHVWLFPDKSIKNFNR